MPVYDGGWLFVSVNVHGSVCTQMHAVVMLVIKLHAALLASVSVRRASLRFGHACNINGLWAQQTIYAQRIEAKH